MTKRHRISGVVFQCHDCDAFLAVRPVGIFAGSGWYGDWFMVKDSVWQRGQRAADECRFLCISCLGPELTASSLRMILGATRK